MAIPMNGSEMDNSPKKKPLVEYSSDDEEEQTCFRKSLLSSEKHPKFKLTRRIFSILFENLAKCPDPKQSLLDSINETVELILFDNKDVTKLGLILDSKALTDKLCLPFADVKRNIVELLDNSLFKLQQSERLVPLFNHPLYLSVMTYVPPIGSKFDPLMGNINMKNMINVKMDDNYCLFHAIVASMEYHRSTGKPVKRKHLQTMYSNTHKYKDKLKKQAQNLLNASGCPPDLRGYGISHVKYIQDYLTKTYGDEFCILIFSTSSYTKPVFKGDVENPVYYLSLFFFMEHFYVIKNLGLHCSGRQCYYYCVPCESVYNHKPYHSAVCPRKCRFCLRIGREYPCNQGDNRTCEICKRIFPNTECFDHHIKKNVCSKFKYCIDCFQTYNAKKLHNCGDNYCSRCYVYHPKEDFCYISPIDIKNNKTVRYVVFDFETTQDKQIDVGVFEHEVNFVCAYVFCTECLTKENFIKGECVICGPKIKKWSAAKGDNCIADFTKWIVYDLNKKYKTIALSHFGGRFDNIFVLKQLFKLNINPECIKNGNKFFEIRVKKGKNTTETIFKDSFNFMSVPLGNLVKTFNLQIQEKMFFPHLFNRAANYKVHLKHLPDKELYLRSSMNVRKQKEFDKWYAENYNTDFYLPDKLDEYCSSDVEILAYAVVEFRKIFMVTCELDPFKESCTIAGACMKTYRSKFLPEKTLAIVPEFGYQRQSKCSTIALKYFTWLAETTGKNIRHGNSPGGEVKIDKYSVDAFIPEEKRIIEFYGCAFHGCPKCYKGDTVLPTKRTAEKEREKTINREEELKRLGYKVESVWECDVRKQLKKDKVMKNFFDELILGGAINPRDAFYGGRCNPHKLHSVKGKGKVIKYLDFTSLYPACNYETSYPVGIPEVIDVPFSQQDVHWTKPEDHNIKGLLKVFIVPPRKLIIPVVPYKNGDFLLFPLCRTCSKTHEKDISPRKTCQCTHNDKQRGFVSTLTHMELNLALQKGYIVKKYYSAYNYTEWSTTLFKPYVKKFLKLKVETDGWPANVKTEEEKEKFVADYKEKFDIDIQRDKLKHNGGLRYISKLCLNSLWGRFSLRNTLTKSLVSNDPLEIDKIMSGDMYEVTNIDLLDQNRVMMNYNLNKDFVVENDSSNIVVSLWTTSAARIKLYEIMEKIVNTPGCQLLYTDTDSVIFECPEDFCPLEVGNFLGELTDEVGPDEEIIEAVIGGNKQYALAIRNKITGEIKYTLKCRGITLNAETSTKLHYEKFKEMVLEFDENDYVELKYDRILPSSKGHVVTKKQMPKKYKVVFKKGYIGNDLIVYPFGYE